MEVEGLALPECDFGPTLPHLDLPLQREGVLQCGSQLLHNRLLVCVDADPPGYGEGLFDDLARRQVRRVFEKGEGGRLGVRAAGSDGRHAFLRLDDVARSRDDERVLPVGDDEKRFELAEDLVGPPFLGEFHGRLDEVPRYCSIRASNFSKRVKASAVAPANPARILSPPTRRTFTAFRFMTVWPTVTCPSPPTATFPSFRTQRIVVERMRLPLDKSPSPPLSKGGTGGF